MASRMLSDLWLSEFINLAQKVCPTFPLLIYEAQQEREKEKNKNADHNANSPEWFVI